MEVAVEANNRDTFNLKISIFNIKNIRIVPSSVRIIINNSEDSRLSLAENRVLEASVFIKNGKRVVN